MSCLFCQSAQLKPEFWETGWDEKENPYYVTVRGKQVLEIGFRTRLYPPDIITRWRHDGGLCFRNKFVPWSDIKEVCWNPPLERKFLDEINEVKEKL